MGKFLLLFAFLIAALALLVRHYHHAHLAVIFFCTALLAAVCGILLFRKHPLADLLDEMRRQAD